MIFTLSRTVHSVLPNASSEWRDESVEWRRRAEVAEADAAMLASLLEVSYAANRAAARVLLVMTWASVAAVCAMSYACWILSG